MHWELVVKLKQTLQELSGRSSDSSPASSLLNRSNRRVPLLQQGEGVQQPAMPFNK